MSFFDKLKFWKKNDDFDDFGRDFDMPKEQPFNEPNVGSSDKFGENLGGPSFENPYGQQNQQQNFQQNQSFPAQQNPQMGNMNTNELIVSKLDTIKAQLDTLNARVANLERIANGSR